MHSCGALQSERRWVFISSESMNKHCLAVDIWGLYEAPELRQVRFVDASRMPAVVLVSSFRNLFDKIRCLG
jgi:hypothetical protein